MKVGGIVLCGGKSSRMGVPKATLPFGPEAMLQRVLRLLADVVEPRVVVAAPGQELPVLPGNVHVVRDREEGRGPLEGLRAGLAALQGRVEAAYVTGCDVPLLVPEFVRYLVRRLENHQVAVPVEGEFHHPLAAVYRLDVVPHIESLLAAGRGRPIFLFETVDTCRVAVEDLRSVDPELGTLANLNRPEDYLAAARRAGFEVPEDIRLALKS
jgi:molybdopterin-guanine dinucleotide biosynthesis protein A